MSGVSERVDVNDEFNLIDIKFTAVNTQNLIEITNFENSKFHEILFDLQSTFLVSPSVQCVQSVHLKAFNKYIILILSLSGHIHYLWVKLTLLLMMT